MNLDQIRKNKKNKQRKRLIFRMAILAVLVGAIVFALFSNSQADKSAYLVGDQAPDFELTQINKNNELESVRLSDLKGKGVMLV